MVNELSKKSSSVNFGKKSNNVFLDFIVDFWGTKKIRLFLTNW